MKMHKTIKRTPKGPWIMFKSLKTNTNRMKNEERCISRLRSQFGNALASFFSSFFFFSLISLNFTKSFQYMKVEPLPSAPSRLFIGNEGTWLICSSPRWVVASTWSNLARPRRVRGYPGWANGQKKLPNDPFALLFRYFPYSFSKRRKTFRIA